MSWEDIGFVIASKNRIQILGLLYYNNYTPLQMKNKLNLHFSQVSITINELKGRSLIKCMNDYEKKGRIYSITEYGKEIYNKIGKIGCE